MTGERDPCFGVLYHRADGHIISITSFALSDTSSRVIIEASYIVNHGSIQGAVVSHVTTAPKDGITVLYTICSPIRVRRAYLRCGERTVGIAVLAISD